MGAGEVGDQAQAGLAHGELHVVGDDAQVTGEGQLEARPDGMPLHGGDGHDVTAPPPGEALLELSDGGVEFGVTTAGEVDERRLALDPLGREHLPVEPGGEGHAFATQHHDPDGARHQPARLGERPPQSGALGVAFGRVGQRHRGEGVLDGEPYAVLVEQGNEFLAILAGRRHGVPPMSAVILRAAGRHS